MEQTPHKDKLLAAINNPKCPKNDIPILKKALEGYNQWMSEIEKLKTTGKERVFDLTRLLNGYKDFLEVDLIALTTRS